MKLNERHTKILQELNTSNEIRVSKLSQKLFVSEMTIRRDLKALEFAGFLKRSHGGAVRIDTDLLLPIGTRMHLQNAEKKEIALLAKKHLKDNQVIFMSSSSTCAYLCPLLKDYKKIHVVTNSLYILSSLRKHHIPCTLTGGLYTENEQNLTGRFATQILREINTDIAFISCEALSEDGYLSDSSSELAELLQIAMMNTKTKIFLMDSSKTNRKCTYNVCHRNDIDELIIV